MEVAIVYSTIIGTAIAGSFGNPTSLISSFSKYKAIASLKEELKLQ